MAYKQNKATQQWLGYVLSFLGALGVALQNFIAVELFIRGIIFSIMPITVGLSRAIRVISFVFGGVASGMVNLFINMDLLEAFLKRISGEKKAPEMTGWLKLQYIAGIVVFIGTGLLFGLTAFAFAITTPFAVLAVTTGLFVAIIMTIQELETWLQSFDELSIETQPFSMGKLCGHIIAAGNVLGLSLLFTMGLAETLMVFQFAAYPALIAGLCMAFSVGAFTEFYFYNFFLAKFCHSFDVKYQLMKNSLYAPFGFFCILSNSLVNLALTYSGVGLLNGFLIMAGVALPSTIVMTGVCTLSGVFAGMASFLLGMDFWIRNMSPVSENTHLLQDEQKAAAEPEVGTKKHTCFSSRPFFQPLGGTPIILATHDSHSYEIDGSECFFQT